jgi:DNA-binding beta-propeller fold protein YncE
MNRLLIRTSLLLALLVIAAGAASAHPGWGIVVDQHGQIYFTDLSNIWKIDAGGKLVRVVEKKHTHSLYLDANGYLYGEHIAYESGGKLWWSSAWRLATDGVLTDVIPPTSSGELLFSTVRDARGNQFFYEGDPHTRQLSRIIRKSPDGKRAILAGGQWGHVDGRGEKARFGAVGTMVVGPGGALFLTDENSVRKITPEGEVSTLASGLVRSISRLDPAGGGSFSRLMGIALDQAGNIYVANYGNRCVQKIDPQGKVSIILKSTSLFWSPSGITAMNGYIYVLESRITPPDAARIRRIAPDGSVE